MVGLLETWSLYKRSAEQIVYTHSSLSSIIQQPCWLSIFLMNNANENSARWKGFFCISFKMLIFMPFTFILEQPPRNILCFTFYIRFNSSSSLCNIIRIASLLFHFDLFQIFYEINFDICVESSATSQHANATKKKTNTHTHTEQNMT